MGITQVLSDFLFGKSPKIFDKKGEVEHDLGDKKWKSWDARYKESQEYNWRNHAGTQAKKDH